MWLQFKANSVKMISYSPIKKKKKKRSLSPKHQAGVSGARDTAGLALESHIHCFGIRMNRSGKKPPPMFGHVVTDWVCMKGR